MREAIWKSVEHIPQVITIDEKHASSSYAWGYDFESYHKVTRSGSPSALLHVNSESRQVVLKSYRVLDPKAGIFIDPSRDLLSFMAHSSYSLYLAYLQNTKIELDPVIKTLDHKKEVRFMMIEQDCGGVYPHMEIYLEIEALEKLFVGCPRGLGWSMGVHKDKWEKVHKKRERIPTLQLLSFSERQSFEESKEWLS